MSCAARPLRLCLRTARRAPVRGLRRPNPMLCTRLLSTTPARQEGNRRDEPGREQGEDEGAEDDDSMRMYYSPGDVLEDFVRDEKLTEEERKASEEMLRKWKAVPYGEQSQIMRDLRNGSIYLEPMKRLEKRRQGAFWNEDEADPEMITDEMGEDDFEEDDITSMAHGKLEEHREAREYARITVWEMPLLSKLAKPFEPPAMDQPLRFRYTTYMGEFHPAERKVSVEFCPKDLPLTEAQQIKLMKLAGPRYDPEKETVKISSDMFEHQAQNKRYLGDLVDKLIAEAKNPNDMFEDIPLDTRHHEFKNKPKFPREWRMTEERKKALESERQNAFLLDRSKTAEGRLVDGKLRIAQALAAQPAGRLAPAELVAERLQRPGASRQRFLRR